MLHIISHHLLFLAYPGTPVIGIDGNGVFVNSFHKPKRELIFQSGVQINLGSEGLVFSQGFDFGRRIYH